MHRNKLIQLLQNYHPSHEEEKGFKAAILDFVRSYPDCFERSLSIGHITASCWLVDRDGSKALLTHHAKLNKWLQLGGHSDGDPDPLAVSLKEAKEESGLTQIRPLLDSIFDIDVHLIPDTPKEKAHFHYDIRFLLQAYGNEEIQQSSESNQLLWITKNISELPTNEHSILRMFHKWLGL
jgi:8-oxo-dGTP pyrophosphatase MutT (NUDIX family)